MFTRNWLAYLSQVERIKFLLGHALYMRTIRRGNKRDDILDQ
jgi:hypothetical protein